MLSASANRVPTSRVQTLVLLTRHKLICYICYTANCSIPLYRSAKLTDNNYGSLIFWPALNSLYIYLIMV